MTTTQNRRSSVSSAVAKRQAMVANSSGLENNQAGKLNAGAAMKRPAIYNISDSYNCTCSQNYSWKKCTISSWELGMVEMTQALELIDVCYEQ
ncbi:hypothetical protein H5410_012973, partial [Solanum commersonii]